MNQKYSQQAAFNSSSKKLTLFKVLLKHQTQLS